MSWQATNWARTVTTGSVGKKLVLLLLADLADEHHSCFPGQERLAKDSEQGERTVRRHLADLEAEGLIRREARYIAQGGKRVRTSDRFYLPIEEPGGRFPARPTGGPDQDPGDDEPQAPDTDLPANLAGRSEGDLPATTGTTYRPLVAGYPLEEPPVELEVGGNVTVGAGEAPAPQQIHDPGLAALDRAGDRDAHGPTTPVCPLHRDQADPPPCGRCAQWREGFEFAERRRADQRRREEADAAIQADRRAAAEAAAAEVRAAAAAEARAAIAATKAAAARQAAQDAAKRPKAPQEPATAPTAAPAAPGDAS